MDNLAAGAVAQPLRAIREDEYDHADYMCKTVEKYVRDFEDRLDKEHEVAVMLASFGQSVTMYVTEIGYSNPNAILFRGYVDGKEAALIQHMSQLNFLLLSVERRDPDEPPRRIKIGFDLSNGER